MVELRPLAAILRITAYSGNGVESKAECEVQRSVEDVRQRDRLLCFPRLFIFSYTVSGNAGGQVAAAPRRHWKVWAAFSPF